MADFSPAFAHANGDKRMPTSGEIEDGFGCGPLSLPLFNGLINALYAELGALMTLNGITPSNASMEQVAQSVQAGRLNFALATGTANAWVVDPVLAVPAYASGRVLWIKAPAANTSATVAINVSGLGTRPVKKNDGTAPQIGDLASGVWYPTIDDGTSICVVSPLPSQMKAASFKRTRVVFTTPGAFSWTVPAGVTAVHIYGWGAGGGSGAASASGAAGGGAGGSYGEEVVSVTPGDTISGSVGVGGAGGIPASTNGATGGDTTIVVAGTTYTAAGGSGSLTTAGSVAGNAVNGNPNTNFTLINRLGQASGGALQGTVYYSGKGGDAPNGGSGGVATTTTGNPGSVPGGGASGAAANGTARSGAAGARGEVWFEF